MVLEQHFGHLYLWFSFYSLIQLKRLYRLVLPVIATVIFLGLGGATKLGEQFSHNNYESHDPQASLVEKSMSVINLNTDVSNIERLNRWVSALRMFDERPFTGFGPGTYQFTYLPFQEKRFANRLTVTNPDSPAGLGRYRTFRTSFAIKRERYWDPFVVLISLAPVDLSWFFYCP